jgi:[acyl-carrier-protein] S-malonyltransferase
MGKDLYEGSLTARAVFDEVSGAVGRDLADLCFNSEDDTLRSTDNAQLALYVCSVAAWRAFSEQMPDLAPKMMAGHSVGEYAALACAGVLNVSDGARLVKKRGELMAAAGGERPGGMAAVLGLDAEELRQLTVEASTDGVCVIANDNCPGQLVISGDLDAVQRASGLAADRGAKRVLPLNVSGAFHSPLMEDSAAALAVDLKAVTFVDGAVPVVSNVTAEPESTWADLLERQLQSPVRWTESVQHMLGAGITIFVECGAGEVLCGLIRRIDRSAARLSVVDTATLDRTVETLKENS